MPIKEIVINNNKYRITCEEGQEQHLMMLVDKVNNRVKSLNDNFKGKCSELTLMLLTTLELEDQLHEYKAKTEATIIKRINKIITQLDSMLDT